MASSNSVKTILTANAQSAKKEVKALRTEFKGLGNDIINAFNTTAIIGWAGALKNVVDTMLKATKQQSNYIESLNLLEVAYKGNTASADALIDKLNTMYGLDPAGLTKQIGIYKQMTSAMGFANETSALLAENLTKMQEDVSSLYNLDFDKVGSKFQSALAGQTRAVRDLGVDITIASLQQELYNRGIDRNVNQLNRASKTALIYLTMERQLANAHGDAARTINQTANQTRILGEQFAMAARQIGGLFLPILQALLPYLNGIMMAINQILGSLLSLIGIDVKSMATQNGISIISSDIDDLGAGLGNATQKAKELKNQLRSFDKLNVITTPTDSGSSSSGGAGVGGGGIDPAILAQLKEYDLADVSMKAQQIKDAFLEWLKVFEPLEKPLKRLSELTFDGIKYLWEHILEPLGKWAKETLLPKVVETLASALEAISGIIDTMKPTLKWIIENVVEPFGRILGKMIINTLDLIKKGFDAIAKSPILQWIIGNAGLLIAFKKLIDIAKTVYTWFGATKLGKIMGTYFDGILFDCIKETKSLTKGWKTFVELATKSTTPLKSAMDSTKFAVKGIVDAGVGLLTVKSSLEDINENGNNVINTISLLVGSIMTIKGAIELTTGAVGILDALFKTSFATNPFTAIIGGLIGAGALIWAISSASDETKKWKEEMDKAAEESKKFNDEIANTREQILKNHENELIGIDTTEKYVEELKHITDENGRIKEGYEDRAKFIVGQLNEAYGTEIKIIDGVVQKIEEEIDTIDKLIEKKKVETYLNIASEKHQEALKRESDVYKQLGTDLDKYNEAQEETKKLLEKYSGVYNQLTGYYKDGTWTYEQYRKELEANIPNYKTIIQAEEQARDAYYNTRDTYKETISDILKYEDMWVANSEDDMQKVIDIYVNGLDDVNERTGERLVEQTRIVKDLGNSKILAAWRDLAKNNVEGYYNDMMKLSSDQRKIISDATGVVVDDKAFAQAWGTLAQNSEEEFLKRFKQLPEDVQKEVVTKMYQEGYDITENLQKGLKAIDPNLLTLQVGVKGPSSNDISKMVSDFNNTLGAKLLGKKVTFSSDGKLKFEAEGGFLNTGEMFVAREAGPELVGRIGNKTAVANNDQIVSSIAKGLAMSGIGGEQNVNIIAKGDTQGLMNFITFEQQKQNRQYGM